MPPQSRRARPDRGCMFNPDGHETIDDWLDEQIEQAENEVGMLHSYHQENTNQGGEAIGRLDAFKETREKLRELWKQ